MIRTSARRRWLRAAVAFGLLLAAGCLFFNSRFYKMHEARCVFTVTNLEMVTNSLGRVVQPRVKKPDYGLWQDPALASVDFVNMAMSDNRYDESKAECVLRVFKDRGVDALEVSNAVDSLEYDFEGSPIPVFVMKARSRNTDIAQEVLSVVAKRIESTVVRNNEIYEQRSMYDLECEKKRCEDDDEDTASINAKIRQRRKSLEDGFYHVYWLEIPHVTR